MAFTEQLLFFSFSLFILHSVNGFLSPKKFTVKIKNLDYTACLSTNNFLNRVINIPFQQCLDECALKSDCRAVNFHRHYRLCDFLSEDDGNFIKSNRQNGACVFVKKSDMELDSQKSCSCAAGETCDTNTGTCSYQECRSLPLDNGKVFGNMKSQEATVTFSCNEGYEEAGGEHSANCLPSGRWTYYPECQRECGTLTLENGEVFGNMTSVGSTVDFNCSEDYIEVGGENSANCLPNGSWSYYPQCKRDCYEPQPLNNATLSDGKTYDGQNKTYTCLPGTIFSSVKINMTTTCQSDGQWSMMVCPTATDTNSSCTGCILAPKDCQDIQFNNESAQTGFYDIYPTGSIRFTVRCDMDTSPGGWTVIQRRISDSDFLKTWNEYKEGFGNLSTNFWLGNDKIWILSNSGNYSLRVDLMAWDGDIGYTEYSSFLIGNESSKYTLNISSGIGPAGDSLNERHNGMKFSTWDQDNDIAWRNCADWFRGAWWFKECHDSNLNGQYGVVEQNMGMKWKSWKGNKVFMNFTELKLRRN